jgi:hypothetical protein
MLTSLLPDSVVRGEADTDALCSSIDARSWILDAR